MVQLQGLVVNDATDDKGVIELLNISVTTLVTLANVQGNNWLLLAMYKIIIGTFIGTITHCY